MDMTNVPTIEEEVATVTATVEEPTKCVDAEASTSCESVPSDLKLQRDLIRKLRAQLAEAEQTNRELHDELIERDAADLQRHISNQAAARRAHEVTGTSDTYVGRMLDRRIRQVRQASEAKAQRRIADVSLRGCQRELIYNALLWLVAALLYAMFSCLWASGADVWAPCIMGAVAAVMLCRNSVSFIKAFKARMQLDDNGEATTK